MKILIIIAMEAEAKGIVSGLQLQSINNPFKSFPSRVYQGEFSSHQVSLVSNGEYETEPKVSMVGTEPGAVVTKLAIDYFEPELVINMGTAGGRKESGTDIGDIVLAKNIFFHDRQVGIPGYKERSIGNFKTWERSEELAQKLSAKFSSISTGNSFEMNELDSVRLNEFQSEAKDMEVAAVAWVCDLASIPLLSMKSITDLIDYHEETSEEQFFANLQTACENLAKKAKELLEFI